MRAVRIARSVGRPSRLKNPPGIFPAAYMRSSTSTVSGKKSAPSRASVRPCAVPSTTVSPLSDDDGAVGLLRRASRLERNLFAADLDGHGNRHPCGVLSLNDAHKLSFLHCAR